MAFQVLGAENQEIFFFYSDLQTNELAFRSGDDGRCSISRVPDLFKVDLINYHNLWDYLFFFEESGHWRLEWPVGVDMFKSFISELHYLNKVRQGNTFWTFFLFISSLITLYS
jgi:hypothetical protein